MMASYYFQYLVPAFLVAVGFIDPGNWVTLIEGGSRFGYELAWVVCSAILLAMLLQMVSARLGVATGKHFAEVCLEELPPGVCTLLGVLCEMSIITLDLTTVLGTAIGLNIVLRISMLPSLFLMVVDSLLFIAILPLMEMKRALYVTVAVFGIVSVCFLLDGLPTSILPVSMAMGLLPKLRHETLYAAISIVGANVMPHNFYLHSAIAKVLLAKLCLSWDQLDSLTTALFVMAVDITSGSLIAPKQDQSQSSQSRSTVLHYCFWGTLFAFGAVLVMNLAVFSVAVTEFHNTGLVVLSLQDAQSLIEQILNTSVCPALFGFAIFFAGQLSTQNGSSAGQVVSKAFFDYHIHPWQHRILIRAVTLVPVAICVILYGNEGIYQMLMFSQVFLALHLPFTVAPLIKLTSSERIMGSHKNSFPLETLAWLALGIISAVNVTLIFDLVFGDTEDGVSFGGFEYLTAFDWLTDIWGENLQSVVFALISMGTTLSLGFLVWLIFTPLQSDSQLPSKPSWIEDYARQEEEALGTRHSAHEAFVDSLPAKVTDKSKDGRRTYVEDLPLINVSQSDSNMLSLKAREGVDADSSTPVKNLDFPELLQLESADDISFPTHISSPSSPSVIGSPRSTPPGSTTGSVSAQEPLPIDQTATTEDAEDFALKKAEAEADAELLGKDDDEMDVWGGLEQDNVLADALGSDVNGCTSSLQLDGPISGRSDTSIGSEGGSGSGSLSRLSGLGRAARRQFSLILDEFWATLFDLHGQPLTPQCSSQAADLLDGDPRGISVFHEGSDGQKLYSKQQMLSWKKQHKMSDANALRASSSSQLSQAHCGEDGFSLNYRSERRYLSMHVPVYHEDYDYQPATIHGYRSPSFTGRGRSVAPSHKTSPIHTEVPLFRSQTSPGHQGDIDISSKGGECHKISNSRQPSWSSEWVSDVVGRGRIVDTKGSDRLLTQTEKHLGVSETSSYDSSQWDPLVYRSKDSSIGGWDPLVSRATGELDINTTKRWANFGPSPIGRGGQGDHVESAPLVFDEISPSQLHRDAFSIQAPTSRPETQSLWSRQPFEQLFGPTDADGLAPHVRKQRSSDVRLVQPSQSNSSISASVDIELEVLENLQICLGKLLRLDGAEWLFRRENGADEDLITAIAMSQKTSNEAELNERSRLLGNIEHQLLEGNSRSHSRRGINDSIISKRQRNSVPNCGKGCIWDRSLLVSFGVWCVHRVLELSLMESRPELWGKYTYVLNRLQGILEPAFLKARFVPAFCRCVQQGMVLDNGRRKTSSKQGSIHDDGNGSFGSCANQSYPHPWPWGRNTSYVKGKGLSGTIFLDMIKEVETAVVSRKGRTGTAAGDVAFPKGKENLASVLKRYKRKLTSKPPGERGLVNGGRKV